MFSSQLVCVFFFLYQALQEQHRNDRNMRAHSKQTMDLKSCICQKIAVTTWCISPGSRIDQTKGMTWRSCDDGGWKKMTLLGPMLARKWKDCDSFWQELGFIPTGICNPPTSHQYMRKHVWSFQTCEPAAWVRFEVSRQIGRKIMRQLWFPHCCMLWSCTTNRGQPIFN